jgi:hypothetical protein
MPVERFIRRENIKRYRKLLREASDEAERQRILKLLAEEERKEQRTGLAAGGLKPGRSKPNQRAKPRARERTFSHEDN